jgi:hypothetical protein
VGSDRARISFDPSRGYRSVVAQQGRVTLEADVNEQASIASESLRLETIDIVGPAGTPDPTGYEVSISGGEIVVAPGTMYVGGWRLTLDNPVPLNNQPDWLDQPATTAGAPATNEVVALLVTEQSVSAVEDQALLEVALGGPDTTARTRLMQHFVELPTSASLCDAAETGLVSTLAGMGLVLNPADLSLDFDASLQVSFFPPTTPTDPCCPPAQGGYLGADNQLVCVTVASFNAGAGTLLWGWNNASFLYRASVVNSQVLQLNPAPVDAAHSPQPGQVIEILQTTAVLGQASDENYIASPQGLVVTLGAGTIYDGTTQQLTLPPGTTLPTDPNSLFVRLWQAEVPFTAGVSTQLDTVSGLAVTVNIKALPTAPLLARPYWSFAVRPNTPQMVYPERYFDGPQPPDGPRQWLCDLAIVGPGAANGGLQVVADCRVPFLPLTEAGECDCCNLVLDASKNWLSTLNNALSSGSKSLSICFTPGRFNVEQKITFANIAVKITGAGLGTVIAGSSLEAVLEFDSCTSVTVSDISVEAGAAGYWQSTNTQGLQGAVTVRACREVDIERVNIACADADLRSASCLAVYNPAPAAASVTGESAARNPLPTAPQYNIRVLNSQFKVGYCQVGILLINADRAQIEGNLVFSSQAALGLKYSDLALRPAIRARLEKSLAHAVTITNSAAVATKKAARQLRRKQRKAAATKVSTQANKTAPVEAKPQAAPEAAPAPSSQAAGVSANAEGANATGTGAPILIDTGALPKLPHVNLGAVGRAHVTAAFGPVSLQFVSSNKLTDAWTEALNTSGLTATSGEGAVHATVKDIAAKVLKTPDAVAPAFRNYVNGLLPQLFSTSSQGIVVAGNVANDIRILNNTIDSTVQGIHVGLGNMKASPALTHQAATQVQICGNTINIFLTPESNGDRHGIFVGSVTSAIIDDNHLQLTRSRDAGQDIYAIKAVGVFGPKLLIERNSMLHFTYGIYTQPATNPSPTANLWKASDNASTSANFTSSFRVTDNIPS